MNDSSTLMSSVSLGSVVRAPSALRRPRTAAPTSRKSAAVPRKLFINAGWFTTNVDLDMGQILGSIKRKEGLLELPPGRVGLFGVRETIEYLQVGLPLGRQLRFHQVFT
jgi:hypothetical protein